MGRTLRRTGAGVGAACLVIGGAACGIYAPKAGVERQITVQLGADSATCPDDLDSTVGALVTCTVTGSGETYPVTVTVTSVQGSDINFDIERADEGPRSLDGAVVADEVSTQLATTLRRAPDAVTCPDLPAVAGSVIRCALAAEAGRFGVTVTVTALQPGGRVLFDLQVDESPS